MATTGPAHTPISETQIITAPQFVLALVGTNFTAGRGFCLGGRPGTAIGYRGKPWPPRDPKTLRLLKLK